MAKASWNEWQNNLVWKGGTDARTDRSQYENYAQEYDRVEGSLSQNALRQLNNAHGFTAGVATDNAPQPSGNHKAPSSNHEGGGGGGGFDSMFTNLLAQYDKLLQGFLNQSAEPSASQADGGFGFEDTVLSRRVLSDDEIGRPGLMPAAGVQRRVMDPLTGAIYSSPQAAMAAGVTSWQYVPLSTQAAAPTEQPAIGAGVG